MYDTTLGTRVLYGTEAQVFASAAWSLTDDLRSMVPDSGGQSFNHLIDIAVLEPLTAAQVIVLIDRVAACLLDPGTAAPTRTALLDATIAAVFKQVAANVQSEIELEFESTEAEDDDTLTRARVASASQQTSDPQSLVLDTPDPECAVMETWQFVIDGLCDRVLPDTDWQLESIALDLEPHQGSALKGKMGIQDDYFIDVVADATVEDAATAWCELLQRITGWRPEIWRFGGGIPMPEDAGYPPQVDVLSFSENQESPINQEAQISSDETMPDFQQFKPVLLSDVMVEIEGSIEEWSSYVDRKNGKVVSLPTDAIASIQDGEEFDDDFGGSREEFLELAKRICDSEDFVPLLSQFNIHEWSIMRDYCETVDGESDRRELLAAVHGNGAFRHFKSTVDRLDLKDHWFSYRDAAIERVVIDWLESESIPWSRTQPGEPPF